MGACGKGMVAMMGHHVGFAHAMIDRIGMGEALDCMLSMAEGEHGRGRDEAKRGERREHDRDPEAEA